MEMQQNGTSGGGGDIKMCIAPISVGSVLLLLFRAVVGVLLDLGLIINPETAQTSMAVHTDKKECSALVRGGNGGEGD